MRHAEILNEPEKLLLQVYAGFQLPRRRALRLSAYNKATYHSFSSRPLPMSSRINIARPTSGSFTADPHGLSNSRPSPAYRAAPANPEDPVEKLRQYASMIEDYVDIYSQPLRPYLPAIGRFLIVVTFLEDALRIITQWGDQIWYLQK